MSYLRSPGRTVWDRVVLVSFSVCFLLLVHALVGLGGFGQNVTPLASSTTSLMNIKYNYYTGPEVKTPADGRVLMKGEIGSSWGVQTDGNDHSCMAISAPDRDQPASNARWTQDVSEAIPGESALSSTSAATNINQFGLPAAPGSILRTPSDILSAPKRHLFDNYDAQVLLDTQSFFKINEYNVDNGGNPFVPKVQLSHLSAQKQPGYGAQCYHADGCSGSDYMHSVETRPKSGEY